MTDFLLGLASFARSCPGSDPRIRHFIAASWSGSPSLSSASGFRLAPRRSSRAYTTYTLNWLPIGGSCGLWRGLRQAQDEQEMSADRAEILERGIKNARACSRRARGAHAVLRGRPGHQLRRGPGVVHRRRADRWPFVRADVTVYDIMRTLPPPYGHSRATSSRTDDQPADRRTFQRPDHSANDEPVNLLIERDGKQFDVSLTARAVDRPTLSACMSAITEGMPAEGRLEVDDVIVKVDDSK